MRVLALPVLRCDGCGDAMVAPGGVAVCARCRRRAALRRRMADYADRRRRAKGRAA